MGDRRSSTEDGLLAKTEISEHQQKIMDEKRAEFDSKNENEQENRKENSKQKAVSDEVKAETEAKDNTNIIRCMRKYLDPKLSPVAPIKLRRPYQIMQCI